MKPLIHILIISFAGILVGCATCSPPTELVSARQAFAHASASPATQLVPAELRKALETLARAEEAFQENPRSPLVRSIAIAATRAAILAETLGATAAMTAATAHANKETPVLQPGIANTRK